MPVLTLLQEDQLLFACLLVKTTYANSNTKQWEVTRGETVETP